MAEAKAAILGHAVTSGMDTNHGGWKEPRWPHGAEPPHKPRTTCLRALSETEGSYPV